MSSNLENRYRRLLRVLPAWYRAEREEEMVGLFLADRTDDLDLEHGWPGWGETGATIALGTRTRFAASGAPARAVAIGDAVRLVAMIGLLVQVFHASQWLGESLTSRTLGGVPLGVALLMLGGAVAMVLGQRSVAKLLVAAMAVYGIAVAPLLNDGPVAMMSVLWQLPLWMTTAALLLGFHGDAPAPDPRPWRRAVIVVALGSGGFAAATSNWTFVTTLRVTGGDLLPVVVLLAGAVLLARRAPATPALAATAWILALLPAQFLHLRTLLAYPSTPATDVYLLARASGLVVVGAALLVVGLRELRRPALPVTP